MLLLALVLAQALPGTKLLDPISYRQVTVFPVVRTTAAPKSDALTLREGISKKLVTVTGTISGRAKTKLATNNGTVEARTIQASSISPVPGS